LPEIVAEFVRLKVDVMVLQGSAAAIAAKQATSVIPIVFPVSGDPIGTGLVASLARPGGNATGLSMQMTDTASKRLELLREAVPGFRRLAILVNVDSPSSMREMSEAQKSARTLGLDVTTIKIRQAEDILPAFETLKGRAEALYVCADPLLDINRVRLSALAIAGQLATTYPFAEYVTAGGLMSYGPNFSDLFRRAADLVDKILRGANPADIPVEQPTKFDLVINLKTAKALGLRIPESLLARADELIE
jgi:putative ABC transport system substrate-binding protein